MKEKDFAEFAALAGLTKEDQEEAGKLMDFTVDAVSKSMGEMLTQGVKGVRLWRTLYAMAVPGVHKFLDGRAEKSRQSLLFADLLVVYALRQLADQLAARLEKKTKE